MIKNIGLIDYDALCQKKYIAPNYDLGLTYAYLKENPNIEVHLVTSLTAYNLRKYDKLMVFKISRYLPHPSGRIENYYGYNIEEYGPGFINREQRPYIKDTWFSKPDFTCYNPILSFSVSNPHHPYSWRIDKAIRSRKVEQVRLYENYEGELLRRDIPSQEKTLAIHDDPLIFFNTEAGSDTIKELLELNYRLIFIQPLDISQLTNTNIIERLVNDKCYASLRKRMLISKMNDNANSFINYCLKHRSKQTDIVVLYEKGKTDNYYMHSMLDLNYYNNLTNYRLRLRPYWDKEVVINSPLTHCLYRFLYEKPYLMSFYEYVFYMGCKNLKVPEKLIRTDEETYDFILSKYGMDDLLISLENWIVQNPEYEEHIFIGGSSKYEETRRKNYDKKRSKYAFGRSPNGIS